MLNVRKRFAIGALAVASLVFAPVTVPVMADDSGKKAAPALDLNAKMQQKLNAKLNGKLNGDDSKLDDSLDSKLSKRVDKKNAETNTALEEQSNSLTAADRSGDKDKQDEKTASDVDVR